MGEHDIDVVDLDAARLAWQEGHVDAVRSERVESMSLGAVLEAACWQAGDQSGAESVVLQWAPSVLGLADAVSAFAYRGARTAVADHDSPLFEVRACPGRAELESAATCGVEWAYFLDRFRRSLVQRLNVPASTAHGIAAAFHEMADNIVQHAGLGELPSGAVAYRVAPDYFEIAVADLGCGVRESLRRNPAHSELGTDEEALLAAVTRGASSRAGAAGMGFADLVRALADLAGTLSFRSGNARLQLDGTGRDDRRRIASNSPEMQGFQMSVRASPAQSSW